MRHTSRDDMISKYVQVRQWTATGSRFKLLTGFQSMAGRLSWQADMIRPNCGRADRLRCGMLTELLGGEVMQKTWSTGGQWDTVTSHPADAAELTPLLLQQSSGWARMRSPLYTFRVWTKNSIWSCSSWFNLISAIQKKTRSDTHYLGNCSIVIWTNIMSAV